MFRLGLADERGIFKSQLAALRRRQRAARVFAETDGAIPAGRDALAEMRDQLLRQALRRFAQIHDLVQARDFRDFARRETIRQSRCDRTHRSVRASAEMIGMAKTVGAAHRLTMGGQIGKDPRNHLLRDSEGRRRFPVIEAMPKPPGLAGFEESSQQLFAVGR